MILLYIHLGIGALCLLIYALAAIDITYKFKKRYPNLKIPSSSWAGKILSIVKYIVVSLLPIINFVFILVAVFNYSELETKTLDKTYQDCLKEDK